MFTEEELVKKCQENIFVKTFGYIFREDPFMEIDYQYCFSEVQSLEELKETFKKGMWAIRQGFIYQNLCFIQQDNGGDEWWVVKKFPDGELVGFESISWRRIILDPSCRHDPKTYCHLDLDCGHCEEIERFEDLMERLLAATKEQCRTCTY